jgi:hypothetical protein
MRRLLLALVVPFFAASAMAESAFNGLDLGVGFALQNVATGSGTHTNAGGAPATFDTTSKTSGNVNFNVGYNFEITDHFLLGAQASLQPFSSESVEVQKVPGTATEFQNNSRYDFSILPGVLLNPNNLLYGKVGYSYNQENVRNANGAWATRLDYSGYVLGMGIKSFSWGHFLGVNNLYVFAEYNYAGYGSKGYSTVNTTGNTVFSSGISLHSSTGLVGFGYVF